MATNKFIQKYSTLHCDHCRVNKSRLKTGAKKSGYKQHKSIKLSANYFETSGGLRPMGDSDRSLA